ncbi:Leo1-like protein-domain-containing protein [Jimgerdemannia flammicorona]|uniref:Leo1-like protein-domain-containing protein n=1 Tax=Jimgerdemannia flammicorona TaxID=994334 RepID=A0A433A239_9FUNG|nr:Leo1-like protein-domain-containing protein [Jimgerdemannia flammicorona]
MSSEEENHAARQSDADLFGSDDDDYTHLPPEEDRAPSPAVPLDDRHTHYDSEDDLGKGKTRTLASESEAEGTGIVNDDDLFGSGDEDMAEEREGSEERVERWESCVYSGPLLRHRSSSRSRSTSRSRSGSIEQRPTPLSDDDEEAPVRSRKVDEKIIPELRPPVSSDGMHYLTKIPNFFSLDPIPFDPDTYEPPETAERDTQDKLRMAVESTIRWRIVGDEKTGGAKKVSNARLVRWDDGSMSLLIGQELFDVTQNDIRDQHTYLLAHQKAGGILESHLQLTHSAAFKPADIKGVTHRNLTAVIADKHTKKVRTKMFVTEKDPEIMKQEAEHVSIGVAFHFVTSEDRKGQ